MTLTFTNTEIETIRSLRTKGERVFAHLDIFGHVIRIDRFAPTNWIAPTYEINRDGTLRRC